MRRRKVKGADEKLLSYKDYVVRDNIESLKGNWNQLFKNDNPIHAEFGTGRGKFLTTLANALGPKPCGLIVGNIPTS